MNRKNGFTLIELLAVIVILAIIALIATPIVLNIIEDSKKSAFVQTGNGIIDAAENYYMKGMLDGVKPTEDIVINFPDVGELEFDGEIPKKGSVIINTEGKVAIGIANDRYCVTKGFNDNDVTVTNDSTQCYNPAVPTLASLATTGTFTTVDGSVISKINEVDDCVFDKTEGACTLGTSFAIKVNESVAYHFYVMSDDGEKVTLIMDRNLGDNVNWYANAYDSSYGPITALTYLQLQTNTWTNLPEMTISTFESYFDGDGRENIPLENNQTFTMHTRLPKFKEINDIRIANGGRMPSWLYINLMDTGDATDSSGDDKEGYWTSTANSGFDDRAFYVNTSGSLTNDDFFIKSFQIGVRPVIELYK